jgi:mutual gliding-motility protein MglA
VRAQAKTVRVCKQEQRVLQLNFSAKEVVLKLVYYGPALSGKTSNLKALHDRVDARARGRLMSLATKDDRTLFFDMLPLAIRGEGMSLRLKVFTVPGQVLHASTRRFVLQGADGVAFIADSRIAETENNATSFRDLRDNLKELGRPIKETPLIIQFNKRDLPAVRPESELRDLARRGSEPVFTASAVSGEGVLESFFGLLKATCDRMEKEHQLSEKLGLSVPEILKAACDQFGVETPVDVLVGAMLPGKGMSL